MVPELYLIAPADAAAEAFAAPLQRILANTTISALLLPRGNRAENAYRSFVKTIAPVAQAVGCAVLIEGEPGLVRTLGADGLHVTGPAAAVKAALAALKPDFIVGAATDGTRDDAMGKGELGLDYIMFGPISGAIAPAVRELAGWWAETMEIPGVLSDPEAAATTIAPPGCEFLALSDSVWQASDPAAAIAAIGARLRLQP
jgi:thiamine-phosphate pyrophosphorylase